MKPFRSTTLILFALFSQALLAHAGDGIGNGGGAHVCRNPQTKEITGVEMYDLYEARRVRNLPDPKETGDVLTHLDRALHRIHEVNPALALGIRSQFPKLARLWTPSTDRQLIKVPDANLYYVDVDCSYEQVVNWTTLPRAKEESVLVDLRYLKLMDDRSVAATFLHEATYAYLRAIHGPRISSDSSREIVGYAMFNQDLRVVIRDMNSSYDDPRSMELDLYDMVKRGMDNTDHSSSIQTVTIRTTQKEEWESEYTNGMRGGNIQLNRSNARPIRVFIDNRYVGGIKLAPTIDDAFLKTLSDVLAIPTLFVSGKIRVDWIVPEIEITEKANPENKKIFKGVFYSGKRDQSRFTKIKNSLRIQFLPTRKYRELTNADLPPMGWRTE